MEGILVTKKEGGFQPRLTHEPDTDIQYLKPVVVLINGCCASASEYFANEVFKIFHVTLVGDTTSGCAGATETIDLPSGFKANLPTYCCLRYDNEQIEWNGIPPKILVQQTKTNLENGHDLQLEFAINFINQHGMNFHYERAMSNKKTLSKSPEIRKEYYPSPSTTDIFEKFRPLPVEMLGQNSLF